MTDAEVRQEGPLGATLPLQERTAPRGREPGRTEREASIEAAAEVESDDSLRMLTAI